jgi:hypothetical protein
MGTGDPATRTAGSSVVVAWLTVGVCVLELLVLVIALLTMGPSNDTPRSTKSRT